MILIVYMVNMLFFISICGFCLNYNYYLKSLIMMEFVMVSVLVIMLSGFYGLSHYLIYIMILGVCEGVMGLLFVVLICRFWGSDNYILIDYSF